VFLASGILVYNIYSEWKFPVTYYLSNSGVKREILKDLIVDILNKLFDIDLCAKLIVCDQGTSNQNALILLNVNETNPFFCKWS